MTKSKAMLLVMVAVFIWGLVEVNSRMRTRLGDPAVERLDSQRILRAYGRAIATYRERWQVWPADIRAIWAMKDFSQLTGLQVDRFKQVIPGHRVSDAGFYRYQPPPATDPAILVMASPLPHRAVPAGAPFGKQGEVAQVDIPATHYALDQNLAIIELSDEEQALRAPWLHKDSKAP